MGIKDLFDKGHSLKFLKNKSQNDLAKDLESAKYIDVYSTRRDRFFPDVDFTTASNFARFGLAELYYENSIKRVYQTYPYDGSLTEKIEWENESTYLDLFIFEHEYPRTNGYITFNSGSSTYTSTVSALQYSSSAPQYISFYGGPHADPSGDYKSDFSAGPSGIGVSKANIYHTASQRTNNLELDLDKGVTVEFWMKKDGTAPDGSLETIFDNVSLDASGATTDYLSIKTSNIPGQENTLWAVLYTQEGFVGSAIQGKIFTLETGESIADGKWKHYAVTFKNKGSAPVSGLPITTVNLYLNGAHKDVATLNAPYPAASGTMVAALGAMAGPGGAYLNSGEGWGNIVSASFDEFRYWKTERDAQQIGRYYRTQIGGGTNTDNEKYDDVTNKVDLGVYYKFNEGIVGETSTDSVILDYSGRISNGKFINYNPSESRNTNSAIILSEAAEYEFKDPIIYPDHPEVSSFLNRKIAIGKIHDHLNGSSIYKSVPGWILEEDESESGHLRFLTQIIASYFDNLYLQMESLPRLRDINYPYDNNYEKPLPFASYLLSSRGFDTPELFADASILSKYLQRGEKKLYENKLYEVKDTIYQNIYNNLAYIQKSKGTIKSLRNLLRCYGVDEELIKINIYATNDTYELKDTYSHTSIKKKFLDFDDLENRFDSSNKTTYSGSFTATAYQYYDSSDSNSLSFIPGILGTYASGAAMTVEAEVMFPKRSLAGDPNYQMFPSLTSSIVGMDAVYDSNTDLTYHTDNTTNFNIVAIKGNNDRRNVSFALVADGVSPIIATLKSDSYMEVYDNQKWNLAFRLRPTKYPIASFVDESLEEENIAYTYEFYGVNYLSNILQNEFVITGTMSETDAGKFFGFPKRLYAGSKRENFTGSISRYSDVKVSSVRFWFDYLPNETIRAHARDANIYGTLHPYKNSNFAASHVELFDDFIPQIETLALNWTLDNVTGSNASGQFLIEDFASGSAYDKSISRYGWVSDVAKHNYSGRADFFLRDPNYADQAIDVEFVQAAKQKLPETVNSDDFIKILSQQDEVVFTRDTTYVQHLISVEKSMYQIISEEMIRFFATIVDFNNLIGDPVNRYRSDYKRMEKLSDLFFEKVENTPDLDKFIEYYKWVDEAVTLMIAQLMPASSNSVELLRNMVESHILERNKYMTKFPTLDTEVKFPISSLVGINEILYNWKFGHAPLPESPLAQNRNHLWWKERAERSVLEISSSVDNVNDNKDILLKRIITELDAKGPTLKTIGKAQYEGSQYKPRRLSVPVHLDKKISLELKGGSNPKNNNIHDYYKGVIKWASDNDYIWIDRDHEIKEIDIIDKEIPDESNKKQYTVKAFTMTAEETVNSNAEGTGLNDIKYSDAKSTLLLPFNMYSSSIDTGYMSGHKDIIPVDFTNVHHDEYGVKPEVPMQGPFTEKYVGGMQYRHADINRYDPIVNSANNNKLDHELTRPEGWELEFFGNLSSTSYALYEQFEQVDVALTNDFTILSPSGIPDDPSMEDNWQTGTGVGSEYGWSLTNTSTPSVGTGPDVLDQAGTGYAFCNVTWASVGQTFGLVTPLIDLLQLDSGDITFRFKYHMYGIHMGYLKVQHSQDSTFQTGVTDIPLVWDWLGASPFTSTSIIGQQQTSGVDDWRWANTSDLATSLGKEVLGTRFYLRFLYTAGITHLGDCAIDRVIVLIPSGVQQNSVRLIDAMHDNHHRPRAIYTREEYAKRPLNIRNIQMTASSPTKAGNYLDRYEYISTVSPEANDPWFVKHVDEITSITAEILGIGTGSIEEVLSIPPGTVRTELKRIDYNCLNKDYISGSVKNRTRFKNKFSSPGGFEVMSRGFRDPAHETYSVYNAMPWRNNWGRKVLSTQLQAHMGQFGVSTHGPSTVFARVYGSEVSGAINSSNYQVEGDASKHKYHRNNLERPSEVPISVPLSENKAASFNGTDSYLQVNDSDSLSFAVAAAAGTPATSTLAIAGNWPADITGVSAQAILEVAGDWPANIPGAAATTTDTFKIPAYPQAYFTGATGWLARLDTEWFTLQDHADRQVKFTFDNTDDVITEDTAVTPVNISVGIRDQNNPYLLASAIVGAIEFAQTQHHIDILVQNPHPGSGDPGLEQTIVLTQGQLGVIGNGNPIAALSALDAVEDADTLTLLGSINFTGGEDAIIQPLGLQFETFTLTDGAPVSPSTFKFSFDITAALITYTHNAITGQGFVVIPALNITTPQELAVAIEEAINYMQSTPQLLSTTAVAGLSGDPTAPPGSWALILTQDHEGPQGNTAVETTYTAPWLIEVFYGTTATLSFSTNNFFNGVDEVNQPVGLDDEYFILQDVAGQQVKFTFDTSLGISTYDDTVTPINYIIAASEAVIIDPFDLAEMIEAAINGASSNNHIDITSGSPPFVGSLLDQTLLLTQGTNGDAGNVVMTSKQDHDVVGLNFVPKGTVTLPNFTGGTDDIVAADLPFSISAWVKMTDATNFPIFEKVDHSAAAYEYRFEVTDADKLSLTVYDQTSSKYEQEFSTTAAIATIEGAWAHVAATANAAVGAKTIKLYINGQQVSSIHAESTGANDYATMHNTSAPVNIGKEDDSTDKFADGAIDEVSLWKTELTAAEVLELYNGHSCVGIVSDHQPGPGDLEEHSQYSNLVSWWKMGDIGDILTANGALIITSVDRKSSNSTNVGPGGSYPQVISGPDSASGLCLGTTQMYDNAFISHMIPRTDKQYAWITGSII